MWFMSYIVRWLEGIADALYAASTEVAGWIFPFYYLWRPLYDAFLGFWYLAYYFERFNEWLDWAYHEIQGIVSFEEIWLSFKEFFEAAINARNWVVRAFWNVWDIVTIWWSTVKPTVQSWIDIATQGLNALIAAWSSFWNITFPEWTGKLNNLKAAWDNFWQIEFPKLLKIVDLETWWSSRLSDVDSLMDTKLKDWFPFYDSLSQLWGSVAEFFTDPEEWLYRAVDRIIERFW